MTIPITVDTAVEVYVNVAPLLDDTDFKTIETTVAYNAAGMDLVWNFITPAGVVSQTAVTPTTGGAYDWTHVGDGMYKIEIPASGGASINNDTEGVGWFKGFATGVLPWVSPMYEFKPANVIGGVHTGADRLQVDSWEAEGGDFSDFFDNKAKHETTIATLASQTSFTLTAGSADDDAYNNWAVIVTDASTSTQKAVGRVSDYTGSTKTVTLAVDPAIFTMAVGDTVTMFPVGTANTVLISDDATAADNAEAFFDGTGYAGTNNVIPTVTTVTNKTGYALSSTGLDAISQSATGMVEIAKAVWDRVITGANHNINGSSGKFLREASEAIALTGTAQAGAASTITLASGASATDDIYNFERIEIIEGTGAGQSRLITDYNGTTKVATVSRAWTTNPDNTSVYAIMGAESDVVAINSVVAAAIRLALSGGQIIPATVDTVTNTHTPTTTEFQADDITEATADHYNGRIVIFTSGALAGQATDITDYAAVGGIGQFTTTALTEPPANNDTFIIV